MPQIEAPERKATRTTILKDEVPAPPLPNQSALPAMENVRTDPEGWPRSCSDGFEYLRSLKPADWDFHEVYLYWTRPGERKLVQIDKIPEAISLDGVRKKFGGSGGGFFTLWINYLGDPRWHKTTQFEMEGERVFQGQPVTSQNSSAAAPSALDTLAKTLEGVLDRLTKLDPNAQGALDMQKRAFDTTLQTIAQKPVNGDGGNSEILKILLTGMMTMLTNLITKGQGDSTKETLTLLKDMNLLATGQASQTNPAKMIEEVGKAIVAIKEVAGEGEGGDWKSVAAKGLIDGIPMVYKMTQNLAAAAESNARAQTSSQRTAQPAANSNDHQTTKPAMPQEVPQPASSVSASQPPSAPNPTVESMNDRFEAMLWDRVAYMIAAGMDGDQIAQWLHVAAPPDSADLEHSPGILSGFKGLTEGMLISFLQSKPEVQAALNTLDSETQEPRDVFLLVKHFLHFVNTGEMAEDEEEPPAIAVEEMPKA